MFSVSISAINNNVWIFLWHKLRFNHSFVLSNPLQIQGYKMSRKKKKTVRIVDKSSVNYTFIDNSQVYSAVQSSKENGEQKTNKITKKSIMDVKTQNRHKVNSRKIKSLQGHSPIYE
jgi:hypothetical protein